MDREKKKSLLLAVFSPTLLRIMHTFPQSRPTKKKRGLSKLIEWSKKSVNEKNIKSIVVPITTERFVLGFTYDPSRVDFNLLYYNDSRPY